jgi:molybdopterin-biosynthesis enzyme MoeA-like protein
MVEHQVLPWLKGRFSAGERATRVWRIFGLPESAVDERISPWIAQKPSGSLRSVWGILAHGNIVEVKLTVSGKTSADLQKRLEMVEKGLKMSFGPALFGTGADTLESVVGRLLRAQKSVLAVAESCTGGLLAQKITSVPGSSDYFWGGWVTYDNRAKRRLGVTAATLRKEGAVSRTWLWKWPNRLGVVPVVVWQWPSRALPVRTGAMYKNPWDGCTSLWLQIRNIGCGRKTLPAIVPRFENNRLCGRSII